MWWTSRSSGPLPLIRDTGAQEFRYDMNFAEQKWVLRALLLNSRWHWVLPIVVSARRRFKAVKDRVMAR